MTWHTVRMHCKALTVWVASCECGWKSRSLSESKLDNRIWAHFDSVPNPYDIGE